MKLVYEKGYEEKQIINPETVNLETLKTDKDYIVTYAELCKASHWRKDKQKGNTASEMSKQIVDEVRTRLEKAGWHAHIFKTGSTECNCDRDLYLHASFGMPQVHQVPFSEQWNIELTEKELFNDDGSLRTMNETLNLLRQRIGNETLDLDKMLEENEITADIVKTVKAIMQEEGLTEIHELDERILRSGAKEYTWRNDEDEAEEEARDCLEDGELWRMEVEAEHTTLSLDDWIDLVISVDGWEHELCTYDGSSNTLPDGKVYWRTN